MPLQLPPPPPHWERTDCDASGRPRSGNRCGHNPRSPRFLRSLSTWRSLAGYPGVLVKSSAILERYFWQPDKILPELCFLNNLDRRQRSERREACIAVLNQLIMRMDVVTMRTFRHYTPPGSPPAPGIGHAEIARATGLTLGRVQRSIGDLKCALLVGVHPITKKLEGCVYRGHNAIITIGNRVFQACGTLKWLNQERAKRAAKLRATSKRERQQHRKVLIRERERKLQSVAAILGAERPRPAPPGSSPERPSAAPAAAQELFALGRKLRGKTVETEPDPLDPDAEPKKSGGP